ncbi:hypothetical protein, partial [Mucilaginibacter gynuensis]|uniref:hypothetical protein n=1 Tax=Mucilaginibacter gynuensis TaxID=1302236 RepID=UPI0031E500F5
FLFFQLAFFYLSASLSLFSLSPEAAAKVETFICFANFIFLIFQLAFLPLFNLLMNVPLSLFAGCKGTFLFLLHKSFTPFFSAFIATALFSR